MNKFDYLIIGNSAGAVGCIEGLRSVDQKGTIALISEEKRHVYSRALIPYYLGGKISGGKMNYRPLGFYDKTRVTLIAGQRATELDVEKKEVKLEGGERLGYGSVLLATGGKPIYPPIAGLDKKNVFSFHNYNDLQGIEKTLETAQNAVVLGGGVIGLMAAEFLQKKGLKVSVVELADRVLAPVIDESASLLVQKSFEDAGVQLFLGTTIREVQGNEKVEAIALKNGSNILCDLLIIGVGVVPRVELAESANIKINRGIVVDKKMRTSAKNVYACGDCAASYNFVTGQIQALPLWPNAYQGGRTAALNMAGLDREYTLGTSMNAMHFFQKNMVSAGINVAEADRDGYEIMQKFDQARGVYRKFILDKEGLINGFILIGQIERAGIFLNLMRQKVNVNKFRQELMDEKFGYANVPDQLRWQLLKEDVILGVL